MRATGLVLNYHCADNHHDVNADQHCELVCMAVLPFCMGGLELPALFEGSYIHNACFDFLKVEKNCSWVVL